MKNLLFLFFLLTLPFFTFSQYSLPLKCPSPGLQIDSLDFKVVAVHSNIKGQEDFGKFYMGAFRIPREFDYVQRGISRGYMKFFKKGLKRTVLGEKDILVSITRLQVNEIREYKGRGRKYNYMLQVEYFEYQNDQLVYLMTDSMHRARTTVGAYFFSQFNQGFFNLSLLKLNKYLNSPEQHKELQLKAEERNSLDQSEILENPNEVVEVVKDTHQLADKKRFHLITALEYISDNSADGLRWRLTVFSRKWDDMSWILNYTFDADFLWIKQDFEEKSLFYDVKYESIGLGASAVKPFSNHLFVELGLKLSYVSEYLYPNFTSPYEREIDNSLFGYQFQQRISLMSGKKAGVVLSAGFYENFIPKSVFLKSSFGFSIGFGFRI